eukprot:TRINITY_DN18402_c0_g1_i1.p1 TRINITY_DN18402_c0_g1~~TRINITY_DN18402_c0_g1_i1.p1  ORF type:complete len:524 (+),score=208.49 TRINITY_DN18402_c0_g1_i1:60-1631(+)
MPDTVEEVLEQLRLENDFFLEQAPEVRDLLLQKQTRADALLAEIHRLKGEVRDIDSQIGVARNHIIQKRGAPPIDDAEAAALAKTSKDELKETATKAVGAFVGAMCKSYGQSSTGEGASKKTKFAGAVKSGFKGIGGGLKSVFGKKKEGPPAPSPSLSPSGSAPSPSHLGEEEDDDDSGDDVDNAAAGAPGVVKLGKKPPRIVMMALDIPEGLKGGCNGPAASQVEITLKCKDPADQTIEDLAAAGAKVELVFGTRGGQGSKEKTAELIAAAKEYFHNYFSDVIKAQGASPDVHIALSDTHLTATGTCKVERENVGGVLGKLQGLASGELDEATSQAILGKYSTQHAQESLRALHHTSFAFKFRTETPFADVLADDYSVNWRFFEKITGGATLQFERRVYRAVQKVVELFSTLAAAKMSVGGRFFRKLNFKVDPLLFRSLEEDPVLAGYIGDHLRKLLGQGVSITDDVLRQLAVLDESLSGLERFTFTLPLLTFDISLKGLDFFSVVNDAAKSAAASAPPKPE